MNVHRLVCSLLAASIGSVQADVELWLAHSPQCNTCDLFEQVAEARGYESALSYRHSGVTLTIPIRWIDKRSLPGHILNQLPAADGTDNPYWDIQLTVLVVDRDRLLSAGNIADSADMQALRLPDAVMFPPDAPEDGHPAFDGGFDYAGFFLDNWNLEYFVDVAMGLRPSRDGVKLIDLAAPDPVPLGSANVIFWGSAGTPLASSMFIPRRIAEIRKSVESLDLDGIRYVTLYGHGPDVSGNDTSYIAGGRTMFTRAAIAADLSAGAASVNRVLTGLRRRQESRSLIIQVGHSGPAGSPLWGEVLTMAPEDLAPLKRLPDTELIIVSGACHGGKFAQALQCGFFAAHPDVTASGCQLSPEAITRSDDYLRHFFRAATDTVNGEVRASGPATLYDAHWYASTRLEDHQISYTTTDALIDEFFAAHPERLPAVISVETLLNSAEDLTAAEAQSLAALTTGLPPDLTIPLTGFVDMNHQAYAELTDARELSSMERNRITALPYKLVLPPLARRILYRSLDVENPAFEAASACEQQSLAEYLGAHPHGRQL